MNKIVTAMLVVCVLCGAFLAAFVSMGVSYATPYLNVEVPSTGERIGCSEDGTASVDVATGSMHWDRTWLSLSSLTSYDVEFGLHYLSSGPSNPLFGTARWCSIYDMKITYNVFPASLTLRTPRGTVIPFANVGGTWYSTASYGVYLSCAVYSAPLRFSLSDNCGNYVDFDLAGKPITFGDRLGRTISLTYNLAGNLRYVTDMWGRSIEFMYDGTPRVTAIRDVVAGTAYLTFTYTGGYLTNVRSGYASGALFANFTFGYDGSNRLNSYTDPDGVATAFGYSGGGLANLATDAATNTWGFTYNIGNTVF
ncbi:MAG: hypothetical protein WC712_14720, partial [Candidatus Brocadiia bacterium]